LRRFEVVDICGFSGMLLVVGVGFLLRMKVSMSGWGGVSGLLIEDLVV
jgi:hypothetical protein